MSLWDALYTNNATLFPLVAGNPAWDLKNPNPNWVNRLVNALKSGWLDDMNGGGKNLVNVGRISNPGQPGCFATHHTTIALAPSFFTPIPFDIDTGGLNFNVGGVHSTATNSTRFTALVAGRYMVGGSIGFIVSTIGNRIVQVRKNGTTLIAYADGVGLGIDGTFIPVPSVIISMAANDYVEFLAYQSSGVNLGTYPDVTVGWMHQIC